MRVFLTGATGLIGRHALARAIELGHQVTALVRSRARLAPDSAGRYEIVEGDLGNQEPIRRRIAGYDVVINCAGLLRASSPEEFRRVNVEGSRSLFRLARESGVRCFVHVGSMGVYALEKQGGVLTEASREEPYPDRRGMYTASKLEADHALRLEAGGRPPTLVILRPSVVFGAGLDLPMGRLTTRLPGGFVLVFGSSRDAFPLTYAGNLADALLLAAQREAPGLFNIVDDPALVHGEYHRTLRGLAPVSPRPIYVPERLILVTARALDLAGAAAGRARHLAYRIERHVSPRPIDVSRAAVDLGYQPRLNLAEAMRRTLSGTWA